MTTLALSLGPPALVRLHDVLICLSKFSDTVAIEAEPDILRLNALNSTKTAFASFAFEKDFFFEAYSFCVHRDARSARQFQRTSGSAATDRFYCQIYLKALLSVFRGRIDRNKDTAVERCDMELHEDPQQAECRLTVKMICGLGVIKSYKLTYEPAAIQHAVFDRSRTTNQWTADPRFLRQVIDHFSLSAEQLDMYSESGRAVFTSFTTKVTDGKVLKYPVHTSVATDKRDFEDYLVEDHMHIAINLKDFKAAVAHAETSNATVTARYTRPCKPLQLAYEFEGINAEFTIMTRGEVGSEDGPSSSRATIPQLAARQTPVLLPLHPRQAAAAPTPTPQMQTEMPPPASQRSRAIRPLQGSSTQEHLAQRTSTAQPPASAAGSMEFDSLFVPADDDRQWDEMNEEEPQDILGWDATGNLDTFEPTLRDEEPDFSRLVGSRIERGARDEAAIPPTQRMSQVCTSAFFLLWGYSANSG
ncbi:Rad9/DDC1 [Penicillium alfredii]|uniref:DNA repair protein rad9 n=1 Tax=Penicillium alfredii TaxID=1506179 RepID=A0A9W9EH55_9EURO|nr:Rad9/DDC1 [Penicillium alfredii]KAJ5081724.1 Rad9/DDC1 [Penicillium alfredii]